MRFVVSDRQGERPQVVCETLRTPDLMEAIALDAAFAQIRRHLGLESGVSDAERQLVSPPGLPPGCLPYFDWHPLSTTPCSHPPRISTCAEHTERGRGPCQCQPDPLTSVLFAIIYGIIAMVLSALTRWLTQRLRYLAAAEADAEQREQQEQAAADLQASMVALAATDTTTTPPPTSAPNA